MFRFSRLVISTGLFVMLAAAIAVPASALPDFTATKTNDAGGAITLGNSFTWSIEITNIGDSYTSVGVPLLLADNLPDTNISYGTPSITSATVPVGEFPSCTLSNSQLTCFALSTITLDNGESVTISFTATPTATGSYVNPRPSAAICRADPSFSIAENSDANNDCSDTVAVGTGAAGPDLTVTKSNDTGDATEVAAGPFTWSLQVNNSGGGDATFSSGDVILRDNLPSSNVTYSASSVSSQVGISGSGSISCSISSSNLSCSASGGDVIMAATTGTFTVSFDVTPTAASSLVNPRGGGVCAVDPDTHVTEDDETNNACANTVTVASSPDLIATKTNNTAGAGIVGTPFTWSIRVQNIGSGAALIDNPSPIFVDQLPDTNISYGTPTVSGVGNVTGAFTCSITSFNLACSPDSGVTVSIAAGGEFTVNVVATPSAVATYDNPRAVNGCFVDSANRELETDETNNTCSDSVSVTTGVTDPDLTVAKNNDVMGSTELAAGAFIWSLQVSNGGDTDATFQDGERILLDHLPNVDIGYGTPMISNVTDVTGDANIACTIVGSNLTCSASGGAVTIGGQTGTFTVSFTATPNAIGSFANPRLGGVCQVDPDALIAEGNEGNNTCADTVNVAGSPDLTATKTNDVMGTAAVGVPFTWSIAVQNIGSADYSAATFALILVDGLPDTGISYGAPSIAIPNDLVGNVSCTIDASFILTCSAPEPVTLPAGGSFTVSFTATPSAVGSFDNPRAGSACLADAVGADLELDETNNTCSDTVTVPAEAALTLLKTGTPNPLIAGEALTFALRAMNDGPDVAEDVMLYDVLPTGATFDAASSTMGCTQPAGFVGLLAALDGIQTSPPSGSLATGQAALVLDTATNELRFAVAVSDLASGLATGVSLRLLDGTLINTLYEGAPPALDDDAPIAGIVQLSQLQADALQVADSHQIRVDTTGNPGGEIAGTVFVAQSPVVCNLGTIEATRFIDTDIVVDVGSDQGGMVLDNVALVDASTGDPNQVDLPTGALRGASAAESVNVVSSADLSIDKRDSVDPIPGGTFDYILEVSNAGPSEARNVATTDVLPAGLLFDSSADGCTATGGTVTCNFGTVRAGSASSMSFTVLVDDPSMSTVTNTATVSGDDPDPDSNNNSDDELTMLDPDSPTVRVLNSNVDTGDGDLMDCETANVRISQLLITFDEPMFDPAGNGGNRDVTNRSNYQLIDAGPDKAVQTTECNSLMGDDVLLIAPLLTYDAMTSTTTLDYINPLDDGIYRFLACGTLHDTSLNPLDGNGDGTGGDTFSRQFRVDSENLLANGHFDCDLLSWTPMSTNPSEIALNADDVFSSADSGSAAVINMTASTDFSVEQCGDLEQSGVAHTVRARYRMSAAAVPLAFSTVCTTFDGLGCTGVEVGATGDMIGLADTGGSWLRFLSEVTPPAAAMSIRCAFQLNATGGDNFDARLDFLSLVEGSVPIFEEDFETGDTASWSSTVGEVP